MSKWKESKSDDEVKMLKSKTKKVLEEKMEKKEL